MTTCTSTHGQTHGRMHIATNMHCKYIHCYMLCTCIDKVKDTHVKQKQPICSCGTIIITVIMSNEIIAGLNLPRNATKMHRKTEMHGLLKLETSWHVFCVQIL